MTYKPGDRVRCDNFGHIMYGEEGDVLAIEPEGVRIFWPIHREQLPDGMVYPWGYVFTMGLTVISLPAPPNS